MTLVDKASAFPKSVQPGIPTLGPKPFGWTRGPLSKHLVEHQRPIKMEDDTEYRLVTVKRSRGGVIERERLRGRDIAVKSQYLLQDGDFLISKRQIVHGACGLVPAELEGSIASGEYSVLRARPTIDPYFLSYLAHSSYFQQTCFHSSIGVHVEKMIFKLDRWLAWDFDIPPIAEQRRIVKLLSTWDRAIAAQEKLVANARTQKNALMQQLLSGKKRLPGFKAKWSATTLGKICIFKGGSGFNENAQGRLRGDYPFIKVSDMSLPGNETEIIHSQNWIVESDLKALRATLMPPRAVVFAKVGAALRLNRRRRLGRPTVIDNNMMAAIPDETKVTSDFLFTYLNQIDFSEFAQVGAVPSINQQHIAAIPIRLPSLDEQVAISAAIMDSEKLELRSATTAEIMHSEKSHLMQSLLTGRRRVKAMEEVG